MQVCTNHLNAIKPSHPYRHVIAPLIPNGRLGGSRCNVDDEQVQPRDCCQKPAHISNTDFCTSWRSQCFDITGWATETHLACCKNRLLVRRWCSLCTS